MYVDNKKCAQIDNLNTSNSKENILTDTLKSAQLTNNLLKDCTGKLIAFLGNVLNEVC